MTQRRKFLAGVLAFLGLEKNRAGAAPPPAAWGPDVIFVQRDTVVEFNPATGLGTQVGTVEGRIQGSSIVNFQFRPVSQTDITFDNRVLITDLDGDQIIFRHVGTGRFIVPPLSDPDSPIGNLMGIGGPLVGTYEAIKASGKWEYLVGRKFPVRSISANPAKPLPGPSYVEVYADSFDRPRRPF
jgi:hypothetical protein